MANVLDQFLISFMFDNKKLAESASQVNSTISNMVKGIDQTLKGVVGAFGTAFSLNVAKNLVEKFADVGSKIQFVGQTLGVNKQTLQQWEQASIRVGGSIDGMDNALLSFQQRVLTMGQGGDQTLAYLFHTYGINIRNTKGELKDSLTIFKDLHNLLKDKTNIQQQAIGARFGLDLATIRLLSLSDEKFNDLMATVNKYGVLNDKQIEQSVKARQELANLNQQWDLLKLKVGEQLLGIFEKLINVIKHIRDSLGLTNEQLVKIGVGFTIFTAAAVAIGGTVAALGGLLSGLAGVKNLLLGIAAIAPTALGIATAGVAAAGATWAGTKIGDYLGEKTSNLWQNVKSWYHKNDMPMIFDMISKSQMLQESGGDPNKIGDQGKAFGLFQIHKNAAKDVLGFTPTDQQLLDPEFNRKVRDLYMKKGFDLSGGKILGALAFFNGGPDGLAHWQKTGHTFNNYGENILNRTLGQSSINAASLNPNINHNNSTTNNSTRISMGNVSFPNVKNPQDFIAGLNNYELIPYQQAYKA